MYPTLIRIGGFEITSFGVLVAIGSLVGLWIFRRELERSHLPVTGVDAALAGLIGGLVGAKLLWSVEHLHEGPLSTLLLNRGGLSWFGGFAGGVGTGLWMLLRRRIPIVPALAAATPALAVGHAIGRIGCFLVGDDYGKPTTLPWGVAFPQGLPPTIVPVHPTQLYEAAALVPIAWLLMRWRHHGLDDASVVAWYCILAGGLRFVIEFLRVNVRVLGPFTLAHLVSLALVATGGYLLLTVKDT